MCSEQEVGLGPQALCVPTGALHHTTSAWLSEPRVVTALHVVQVSFIPGNLP